MKVNNLVMTTLCMVFTSLVSAGDDGSWRLMSALSSGPTWSTPGAKQTVYLQAELPETFAPNFSSKMFGIGEIFLGLQHPVISHLYGQFGIAIAGTTGISLNGDIWQDADPDLNNLSYKYKISHDHLAVKAKLLTDVYQLVQPYISASLGAGFNHAYQYSSTPKLFEVLPEPPFVSQTRTAFTYSLGIGLQRVLNSHWSVGLGYEFADWGKTSLAASIGQASSSGLNLNHVYTNELQCNLSFVV